MNYVAWHNGQLLPDTILENIIAAAKRGKMTKAASKLVLVPDKRGMHRDKNGIRFSGFKSVKKSECLTLGSVFPHIQPA